MNRSYCKYCGDVIDEVYEGKKGIYCSEDCRAEAEPENICDYCGEFIVDFYVGTDGNYCCSECRDDGEPDNVCERCGRWEEDVDYYGDIDQRLCGSCAEELEECPHCGHLFWSDEGYYSDETNYNYCSEDCRYEAEYEHSEYVNSYGYKPHPLFWNDNGEHSRDGGNARYYGLEIEMNDDYVHKWTEENIVSGRGMKLYLKEDGSLADGGFEIVSHPMTLKYHLEHMDWDEVFRIATSTHWADSGCGFHIHISNDSFADPVKTKANLCRMFNKFWDEIKEISERDDYDISSWCNCPVIGEQGLSDEEVCRTVYNHGRYQAVNLSNDSTTEIRMWRGINSKRELQWFLIITDVLVEIADKYKWSTISRMKWDTIYDLICERNTEASKNINVA